jgi:hypothetical protein
LVKQGVNQEFCRIPSKLCCSAATHAMTKLSP